MIGTIELMNGIKIPIAKASITAHIVGTGLNPEVKSS